MSSQFNKFSTAEDVTNGIDLSGKNIVITGVNSGLGQESMKVLAARGAHIIGTARTIDKANAAAAKVEGKVTPMACELSNFDSVKACAESINALEIPVDVLLCNAGIMALPKLELANGFEQQFNTNHLGHFIFANNLLDRVKEAEQGRIVLLSSLGHKMAPKEGIDFDNLDGSKSYSPWPFYGQAKLANLLTAVSLAKQLEGSNATANAVHPGVIRTNLSRHMAGIQGFLINNPLTGAVLRKIMGSKTVEQGAATQCYVATAPALATTSGRYFSDCNVERPSKHAQDEALAERLWEFSCETLKDYV